MKGRVTKASQYQLIMPSASEHQIQVLIADCLRLELGPERKLSRQGVVWFSVDHAHYGGVAPGIRVARGIPSGLPDVFVSYRGRLYLIEIKKPGGSLSESQTEVLAACGLSGIPFAVVDNEIDVMRALDTWGIPRRRRMLMSLEKVA